MPELFKSACLGIVALFVHLTDAVPRWNMQVNKQTGRDVKPGEDTARSLKLQLRPSVTVSGLSVSLSAHMLNHWPPLRGNLITLQDGWIYETMVFGTYFL